jgi:hypothetical protein
VRGKNNEMKILPGRKAKRTTKIMSKARRRGRQDQVFKRAGGDSGEEKRRVEVQLWANLGCRV